MKRSKKAMLRYDVWWYNYRFGLKVWQSSERSLKIDINEKKYPKNVNNIINSIKESLSISVKRNCRLMESFRIKK